ncbi:MAG: hypothetical protein RMK29_21125 [Myxococcales bacterium]|nr:hypothetical protein [Myxococcota bacterium]MDW8284214.1 hypothetical protein [Myxococcales bacterium]
MQEVLERATGPSGEEMELRRHEGGFVVVRDGQVVLASAARRSERELVRFGLAHLQDRNDVTVLLGGLGMGHTLSALLDEPCVARVDVVEQSAAIVQWNRTYLSVLHNRPPLADERVHVHTTEFTLYLRRLLEGKQDGPPPTHGGHFLAVVLDLDNGPSVLWQTSNGLLYTPQGLALLEEVLRPGGVLSLWSERREPELMQALRLRFQNLAEIAIPVDLPNQGLDYLYRGRRGALPKTTSEPGASSRSSNGHSGRN